MKSKKMLIGYHTNSRRGLNGDPDFFLPAKKGRGVDFILCHFDPAGAALKEECEKARRTAEMIKQLGAEFIANFEEQNFNYDCKSSDGYEWATHEGGVHRLEVPEVFLKALSSAGNFLGVMYDEFEHVIINRNLSLKLDKKVKNYVHVFKPARSADVFEQGRLLDSQLREYASGLFEKGAQTLSGEHVFPVLFHRFAKAGIIPNFKSQKESFSNVQFAVAAGAALQYGTELWNCVDLWYRLTFPGHSPKELFKNLEFAFLTGVNRVYVEASSAFFDDKNGEKVYNAHGEAFTRFANEYKGRERDYDISDYRPEVGIVRYDDGFWGQGRPSFPWCNMLLGNPKIKADSYAREWIRAMNLVTHGETGNGGISWDKIELNSLRRHRSFASMNSLAVFDDEVKKETLEPLKLCILCGRFISPETLDAVRSLVRENGLTVVSPKRYLPAELYSGGIFTKKIKDGSGAWIRVSDFRSPVLRLYVKDYIGKKGEMSYRFGDKTLRMKIDRDGEGFKVV